MLLQSPSFLPSLAASLIFTVIYIIEQEMLINILSFKYYKKGAIELILLLFLRSPPRRRGRSPEMDRCGIYFELFFFLFYDQVILVQT